MLLYPPKPFPLPLCFFSFFFPPSLFFSFFSFFSPFSSRPIFFSFFFLSWSPLFFFWGFLLFWSFFPNLFTFFSCVCVCVCVYPLCMCVHIWQFHVCRPIITSSIHYQILDITIKSIKWNKFEINTNSCTWVHRTDVRQQPFSSRQKAKIHKQILNKTWWWWQAMAPHPISFLALWPSRPPAIETPPRPVPAGPLISWPKNASCSRIPPRASRASLSPRRWAMPRHRLSLCLCTAPLSCSLQHLLKLSLLSLRPSLIQFVSIVSTHSSPLPCALAFPPPSHRDATTPSPCWAPDFMTQERIMFSNPTPSKPRLSPAATMSDVTPSSLTPSLHYASILQPAAPPQVDAFES